MRKELKWRRIGAWIGVLAVAASVALLVGCEDGTGTKTLSVSPAEAVLGGTTNQVLMSVDPGSLAPLSLPLEWKVANPSQGLIVGAAGYNATYVRTSVKGVNVVTVRDQFDATATVTIKQE